MTALVASEDRVVERLDAELELGRAEAPEPQHLGVVDVVGPRLEHEADE